MVGGSVVEVGALEAAPPAGGGGLGTGLFGAGGLVEGLGFGFGFAFASSMALARSMTCSRAAFFLASTVSLCC